MKSRPSPTPKITNNGALIMNHESVLATSSRPCMEEYVRVSHSKGEAKDRMLDARSREKGGGKHNGQETAGGRDKRRSVAAARVNIT
jgi:hypothetical protein